MANYYTVITPVSYPVELSFTDAEIFLLDRMGFYFGGKNYFYCEEGDSDINLDELHMFGNEESEYWLEAKNLYLSIINGFGGIDQNGYINYSHVLQNALKRVDRDDVYIQVSGASYCDKARQDSSSGFACHITKNKISYMSTSEWLKNQI